MSPSVTPVRLALVTLLGLSTLAGLWGCGKASNNVATVKGTVKNKDKILKSGTISFYGADNTMASASIMSDGTYVCQGVPMGDVKVTITQPQVGGLPGGGMPQGPKVTIPDSAPAGPETDPTLPGLVGKPETTNLKYTITTREQALDVVVN
ncbi:MAG: hypothetical protein C0467_25095 [Planctomycetaceae bacterium]|nr:hypothetical protein [Planctomycetaceae bacterium]